MGMKPRATPWQRKASSALRDSIAHWERMRDGRAGGGENPSAENCACCRLWFPGDEPESADCIGCPIALRSGERYCAETPYLRANKAWRKLRVSDDPDRSLRRFKRAADAEVVYLRDTLRMVERGEVQP